MYSQVWFFSRAHLKAAVGRSAQARPAGSTSWRSRALGTCVTSWPRHSARIRDSHTTTSDWKTSQSWMHCRRRRLRIVIRRSSSSHHPHHPRWSSLRASMDGWVSRARSSRVAKPKKKGSVSRCASTNSASRTCASWPSVKHATSPRYGQWRSSRLCRRPKWEARATRSAGSACCRTRRKLNSRRS